MNSHPIALLLVTALWALVSEQVVPLPSPSAALDAVAPSIMPTRPTNAPLELESVKAAKTNVPLPVPQAARIPVYVIPEAVLVQTPQGHMLFIDEFHLKELTKKFPSARITNIVIWNR